MVSRIVTQVARESFEFAAFVVSVWENTTLKELSRTQFASEDVKTLPLLTLYGSEGERIQLVYEIILLNKILRDHLLSENLQ